MRFDFEKPKFSFRKAIAGCLAVAMIAGQSGITTFAEWIDVDQSGDATPGDVSGEAGSAGYEYYKMVGDSCSFSAKDEILMEKYTEDGRWDIFTEEDWENVTLSYQWKKLDDNSGQWNDLEEGTASTYELASIGADDFGEYRCVISVSVSNEAPEELDSVYYSLMEGYEITFEEGSFVRQLAVKPSGTITATPITAMPNAEFAYQWYDENNENRVPLEGATESRYDYSNITGDTKFSCEVTATTQLDSGKEWKQSAFITYEIYPISEKGTITENKSISVTIPENVRYAYCFVPSKTGEYIFTSESEGQDSTGSTIDPFGELYDSKGNWIGSVK